jgi:hypothetical protein
MACESHLEVTDFGGLLAESYTAALRTADLEVTDRRLAAHARIRDSAGLTETYLGVLAGMRSAEELAYA